MDEEFVADLWNLFKDYLDKKHNPVFKNKQAELKIKKYINKH